MVKKTVTPATISLRGVTPCAFSAKSFSSIAKNPPAQVKPGREKRKRPGRTPAFSPELFPVPELGRSCAVLCLLFMGSVDNGSGAESHAIIGFVAVRHEQGNYVKGNFAALCAVTAFFVANPVFAADSILDAPPPNPCTQGADYVPGIDAAGQPVARADIGAEHTAIPDQVYVPLPGSGPNRGPQGRGGRGRGAQQAGEGPYAAIDGKRLDSLINGQPCQAPAPPAARRR